MGSSYWIILLTCLPGLMSNQDEYGISQSPLDYNGSKRTACPKSEFDNQPADRFDSSITLRQLRSEMVRMTSVHDKPLDGYIITSDDDHQSESVSPHDMRREFLTGFYGSAGEALITSNKAVLWTDGRYHLQADQQLDCNWILMKYGHKGVPSITEWLINEFDNRTEVRIGADPMLIPAFIWESWENQLAQSSVHLIAVTTNLIDLIWQVGRPKNNSYAAYPLEIKFAGKPWQEKVRQVRLKMELSAADALVVTALDDIAWLLNIRGWDLPNTPVLKSYVIITQGSIYLYADRHKILRSVDIHLKTDGCYHADCVRLQSYSEIWNDLRTMSQTWSKVWLPSYCGYAQGASRKIYISIPAEKRLPKPSPIIELRAIKNDIEILGMRKAHLRDAVAMCDFMAYIDQQLKYKTTKWDEMQVARVVNEFRLEMDYNQGIAFPTIAGYGPHGALPHYEPSDRTSLMIDLNSTLVIDSGGQYFDGTTDVTRTIHFGEPTQEQREAYTRVLIGSIELASLIFPSNLRTDQLDILARRPLWDMHDDYMHGTGHGIGHFLSVHEPPISVSYNMNATPTAGCTCYLSPGNFLSNEPGYYKAGDFGIRLENILEVVEADSPQQDRKSFFKFRDATLIPYEPKLIDTNMLSPAHRRWLNDYNNRIRNEVGPELKKHLRMVGFEWMMKKTRSIPEWGEVDERLFVGAANPSYSKYHCALIFIVILLQI
ncbi:xaa-Pro aminopeptidase ApepP isoform X1 [Microplitis demolitor]|uniref:xaa-Pro aminopeptidase ApepP isoform X1 n=2 Tax=Microplitis demolitor TaxID=69319 RepID=UPI00235B5EF7|nr:xaa-Pro aminopeptidase ApepP isoform X1 [Microplitis demolitor]